MASINDGGIRVFSAASKEAVEELVNDFLVGTDSVEDRRKIITQAPVFLISGGVFYVLIVYEMVN